MQQALAAVMGPGGGNADLEKAKLDLQQHLTSGKAEDARLGRVAVRRDRARFDPEVRAYNDFRAEAESQRIARDQFTAGGRDQPQMMQLAVLLRFVASVRLGDRSGH